MLTIFYKSQRSGTIQFTKISNIYRSKIERYQLDLLTARNYE